MSDTVDWGPVTIDGIPYLLPVAASEVTTIGPEIYRVDTHYKNYSRFGVSTSITIHHRRR
jgi:hypothetical protein